jgi:hypothetical protein
MWREIAISNHVVHMAAVHAVTAPVRGAKRAKITLQHACRHTHQPADIG